MKQVCFCISVFALLLTACKEEGLIEKQIDKAELLTKAPPGFSEIPFPEENPFSMEKWALGKKLFYDPILSVDQSTSCASCHNQQLAFADSRAVSPGAEGRLGSRNAPSLANVAYHPYYTREGGVPTLEMQVLVPIQEHEEFANNIVTIAETLNQLPDYVAMSKAAFDREPDAYVITRALATFERTLNSANSLYDQGLLSAAAERGKELFFSERTNCSVCHAGPDFTDYRITNNGLYPSYKDAGRYRLTLDSSDLATFKVPSLRNVALTAPYMHNGAFTDLKSVLAHYSMGGQGHPNQSELIQPLDLTAQEMEDIISFLESLTDVTFTQNELYHEDL